MTNNAWNSPDLTTDGQVLIGNTGSRPTAATLTEGSNITITNGPGAITIAAAGGTGGSIVFLAQATASSSASIEFTSEITSTYDSYLVFVENILAATDETGFQLRFSNDGGSTYETSNYQSGAHTLSGSNPSSSDASNAILLMRSSRMSNVSDETMSFTINIVTPNPAGLTTTAYSLGAGIRDAGTNAEYWAGGMYQVAETVNGIEFTMISGNITSGTIKLYGILDS